MYVDPPVCLVCWQDFAAMQVRWLERGGLGYTPWPPICIGEGLSTSPKSRGCHECPFPQLSTHSGWSSIPQEICKKTIMNPRIPLRGWMTPDMAGLGASWWPSSWTGRKMSSLTQELRHGGLVELRSLTDWNSSFGYSSSDSSGENRCFPRCCC